MKTPLRYQITEFDCGTVSLTNCITYLFNRAEIPAELIKAINTYTLDCYDEFGNLGQDGTSRDAVKYITSWLVKYSEKKDFGIKCKYLEKDNVDLLKIKECIQQKGCVNIRSFLDGEHYLTITHIDKEFVYFFDPYYQEKVAKKDKNSVEIIFDKPFKYNRKVKLSRFLSEEKLNYALGPIDYRECVLINRK